MLLSEHQSVGFFFLDSRHSWLNRTGNESRIAFWVNLEERWEETSHSSERQALLVLCETAGQILL